MPVKKPDRCTRPILVDFDEQLPRSGNGFKVRVGTFRKIVLQSLSAFRSVDCRKEVGQSSRLLAVDHGRVKIRLQNTPEPRPMLNLASRVAPVPLTCSSGLGDGFIG